MRGLDIIALFAIGAMVWVALQPTPPSSDAAELQNAEHGPGIECHDDPMDFQHQYCAYEI